MKTFTIIAAIVTLAACDPIETGDASAADQCEAIGGEWVCSAGPGFTERCECLTAPTETE